MLLLPQQRAVPPDSTAHAWVDPAATATASVIPSTDTGLRLATIAPSPNWPALSSPQHRTVPSLWRAHVNAVPPTTCTIEVNGVHAAPNPSAIATTATAPASLFLTDTPEVHKGNQAQRDRRRMIDGTSPSAAHVFGHGAQKALACLSPRSQNVRA